MSDKKCGAGPSSTGKNPAIKELEPGTYYWCSCGHTTNEPFCDASHKDKNFSPVAFEVKEKKEVALCMCKQTGNAPFCDGTHLK